MTVLVVGPGAEDVEAPLGAAVLAGHTHPAGLIGFDLVAARTSCTHGEAEAVLRWYLREERPDRVLLVGTHGVGETDVAAVREATGNEPEHLTEAEAPGVLRRLVAQVPRPAVTERAPRVTLAMAVYNQEPYLEAVLRAALDQTYDDYEVLVLDDGSTDSSPRILERFAGDPRLRVLRQANLGQTGRIDLLNNRMVRHSRGELLAVVGGDDVCRPDRLRSQVDAFDEDPALDVCHGAMSYISADGTPLGSDLRLPHGYDEASMLRLSVVENLVAHPTVMVRRSAHERLALYTEGLVSDYELWLKAAGRLRFRYLPQRLVDYRLHERSLSTSSAGHQRCVAESHRLAERVLQRRSLADLFPELLGRGTGLDWYAAGLHLGNRLFGRDPAMALHLYEAALQHHDGAEAHHNASLAHMAQGEAGPAVARATRAAQLDAGLGGLHRMLTTGTPHQPHLLSLDSHLASALEAGRRGLQGSAWDGGPASSESVYAVEDVADGGAVREAATSWAASTRPGDPVRWVVPSLGLPPVEVLHGLLGAGVAELLAGAAEVVVEAVDDLRLLPPGTAVREARGAWASSMAPVTAARR